jgi:predicted lipoprotein with Yx(FWY)xxD motif
MDKKILAVVLVVLVIAGVYWFSSAKTAPSGSPSQAQTTTTTSTKPVAALEGTGPIRIATATSGKYLADKSGLTLYVDIKDEGQSGKIKSVCTADCEKTWIPFIFDPNDSAAISSTSPLFSKINVFDRADGKKQYALGTKPLFRYVGDTKLGDVNGPVTTDWMVAKP